MSQSMTALMFAWEGDVMRPLNPLAADRQYVIGERYNLEPRNERSSKSHNHYFAAVHEGWLNLQQDQSERFPSSEHLRKWALVQGGYCDKREFVADNIDQASKIAAFIRGADQFAVIIQKARVLSVYTATSQSDKAMGKADFQKSKEAVLDIIAGLIEVSPEELKQNAGVAA